MPLKMQNTRMSSLNGRYEFPHITRLLEQERNLYPSESTRVSEIHRLSLSLSPVLPLSMRRCDVNVRANRTTAELLPVISNN